MKWLFPLRSYFTSNDQFHTIDIGICIFDLVLKSYCKSGNVTEGVKKISLHYNTLRENIRKSYRMFEGEGGRCNGRKEPLLFIQKEHFLNMLNHVVTWIFGSGLLLCELYAHFESGSEFIFCRIKKPSSILKSFIF